jgi:hypothetical protein
MYQQIQGLNTEEKGLEISKIWRWIVQNATLLVFNIGVSNSFVRYEHAKSIQQNVRFDCQTISENIQKLKQEKFKDLTLQIQEHWRPWIFVFKFKDIQGLSSFVRTLLQD